MYKTKLGFAYHSRVDCKPEICAVHKPSKSNPMRTWKFQVRLDKFGVMERFCPHGVGHTDPDSMVWVHSRLDKLMGVENVTALGTHGCCGCCGTAEIALPPRLVPHG